MKLRPYQLDLAQRTHAKLIEHRKVVMQLATGGGKTAIAGAMAQALSGQTDRQVIALYLVHRQELVEQTVNTLKKFGLGDMIGRIQSGYPETRWKPMQVGSIPTLYRRLGDALRWLDPLIVIVDECHHSRARSWAKVIEAFPKAYRLGMTATPARLDGLGLGEHFEVMVFGPPIAVLTPDGYLAPMDLFAPPTKLDRSAIKRGRHDFSAASADDLVTGPVIADEIKNWLRLGRDDKTLHFAVTVRHSLEVVARLRALGISAEHVDGKTDPRIREAIFRRFEDDTTQFVSNVEIATEGFDCPECTCVMMSRPTESIVLYKQMAGRGMRPKPAGRHGKLIDCAGNILRHGPPDDTVEWTLEDGAQVTEEGSKRRSPHKLCPECDMLYPAKEPACLYCGYEPQTRQPQRVDVDLVEWGNEPPPPPNPRKKARLTRRELNTKIVDTLGDKEALEALCAEYGYAPSAVHQWKTLFRPIWAKIEKSNARKTA